MMDGREGSRCVCFDFRLIEKINKNSINSKLARGKCANWFRTSRLFQMKTWPLRCENKPIMMCAGCIVFIIPTVSHWGLPETSCEATWMHCEFQRQSHRTKTNNTAVSEREEKHISYGLTLTTEQRRLTATLWNSINTYRLRRHLKTAASILCCLPVWSERYICKLCN